MKDSKKWAGIEMLFISTHFKILSANFFAVSLARADAAEITQSKGSSEGTIALIINGPVSVYTG
jgi:hypothetical protein